MRRRDGSTLVGGKVRWWGYSLCVFIVSRMMEVGVEGFFVSSFSYGRVTATVSTQTGRERDDGLMAGWTSIHEYTPQYSHTRCVFSVFCFRLPDVRTFVAVAIITK